MRTAIIIILSAFSATAWSQSTSGTIKVQKAADTAISGRLIYTDFWIEPKIKLSIFPRKKRNNSEGASYNQRSGRIPKGMTRRYPASIHLSDDASCLLYFSDLREAIANWRFDGDTLTVMKRTYQKQAKAPQQTTIKLNRVGASNEFVLYYTYNDRPARVTCYLINEEDAVDRWAF